MNIKQHSRKYWTLKKPKSLLWRVYRFERLNLQKRLLLSVGVTTRHVKMWGMFAQI